VFEIVPIYTDGEQAQVDVKIGGREARMLIDTGASVMTISKEIADELIEDGTGEYTSETAKSELADGSVVEERIMMVKSFNLGRHHLENIEVMVMRAGTMPLLPFSLLSKIGRFSIDTQAAELRLG
jgi:clan AA aspartic protease (TIGR02281 family)